MKISEANSYIRPSTITIDTLEFYFYNDSHLKSKEYHYDSNNFTIKQINES